MRQEAYSFVCDNGAGGKLQLAADQRRGLDMWLSMNPGAKVEATFKVYRPTRSNAQNRFWWGVIVPTIAEHLGYHNDEMHEALKVKFLALDPEPNEHGLMRVRGTSTLNTKEFTDLIENVVTWAGAEFGINIPMPDELKKTA